jgi:hypothetical protein
MASCLAPITKLSPEHTISFASWTVFSRPAKTPTRGRGFCILESDYNPAPISSSGETGPPDSCASRNCSFFLIFLSVLTSSRAR